MMVKVYSTRTEKVVIDVDVEVDELGIDVGGETVELSGSNDAAGRNVFVELSRAELEEALQQFPEEDEGE